MKLNITYSILSLLFLLVCRSFIGPLSIAEGLIGVAMVGYAGFIKYIEWKKSREVDEDLNLRIKNIESKLSLTTLAKTVNQGMKF